MPRYLTSDTNPKELIKSIKSGDHIVIRSSSEADSHRIVMEILAEESGATVKQLRNLKVTKRQLDKFVSASKWLHSLKEKLACEYP